MTKEEISFKDLNQRQLENLKDIYIESRLDRMTGDDLSQFVRTILTDQIKGTVGNEEEREAWKEMKDHFGDDFGKYLKELIKNKDDHETATPEQKELERRIKLLEQRKKESNESNKDMW